MKKNLIILAVLAALLFVPSVYAAEDSYARVENDTFSDSLIEGNGVIAVEGSETSEVTVTVNGGKFKILGAGDIGRPTGYSWIGLKFTMPEGATEVSIDGEEVSGVSIGTPFTEYFGINVEKFTEAAQAKKDYEKSYILSWKDEKSEEHKQTIKIVVKIANTVLVEETGENEAWNEAKYLQESNQVKVTVNLVYENSKEEGAETSAVLYVTKGEELASDFYKEYIGKYNYVGTYSDSDMKTKFDFTKALTEDTKVYVKFTKLAVEKTPETGDNVMTFVSLSVVAIVGILGSVIYLRKVNE